MKKILLLLVILFISFVAQSETITHTQADDIVLEHMGKETTQQYVIYAKKDLQENMIISTIDGETLELAYPCWIYHINYIGNAKRYMIVKENTGDLLEINTKNNAEPKDLSEWRVVSVQWDYPIKPGTEEWINVEGGHQARLELCRIPEYILRSISTFDLMILCLQYPFFSDVYIQNCLEQGLDLLFIDYYFNSITELYQREDVFNELLKHYDNTMQNMSISDANNFDFKTYVSNIELLLSLPRYYLHNDDLTTENYKEILLHLIAGYEKQMAYTNNSLYRYNLYSRVKMILEISPESADQILRGVFCGHINQEDKDVINELSYQLIK